MVAVAASMRPWPCSHGYYSCHRQRNLDRGASMRPRPCSHGYAAACPARCSCPSRFNEAVALQPRIRQRGGHPRGAASASMRPCAATDTSRKFRRKRRQIPASMRPWPCSHGYRPDRCATLIVGPASMRPWPCSHGYIAELRYSPGPRLGFNEAVALQPRIRRSM